MVTEQMQSPPAELDPYKVELTRYQKGNYGWVVRVTGKDIKQVWDDLVNLNASLSLQYGITPVKGE